MTRDWKLAIFIGSVAVAALAYDSFRQSAPAPTPTATAFPSRTPPDPTYNWQNWSPEYKLSRRKEFIQTKEKEMLDQGHDFYLSLKGKNQDQLEIKYVLMSRPSVHQLANNPALLAELKMIGFTAIHCTDGYKDNWTIPIP